MNIDVLENPFLAGLGMTRTGWHEGYAEFRLNLQLGLLNRQRVLQGGVVATLLDAACGYAGLYSADPQRPIHGVTLSLTLNFLDKGVGETVIGKGFLERKGRSIFFARGEAWIDSKTLIATAQGTFKYAGGYGRREPSGPAGGEFV
ncbi:PaaI family thioesterase [Paraburkholderia sp.]|jgi:acyl-coenzyme A thioesterase PaaI-like protein|uniref:PaaI family thioesterase n=1 Tax=Paraburkholderia sp. TaxID=1926495 RepID=UPI002F4217FF